MEPTDIIEYRSLLTGIAYRMLGEKQEAEDIVQDAIVHWLAMDTSEVNDPRNYLMRMVTNRSIDRLRKLKEQRTMYKGPWLPEPVVDIQESMPETGKDISIGFLFLLEKLNPLERAIVILRESFDLSYKDLESILGISETTCRQHLHRAKEKLQKDRKRFDADIVRHRELLDAFIAASLSLDQEKLISMLKQDICLYGDGGGKVTAATQPLFGQDVVSRFIIGLFKKVPVPTPLYSFPLVNGLPALALFDAVTREPITCVCFDYEEDKISNFYFIRNPDKLKNLIYQG